MNMMTTRESVALQLCVSAHANQKDQGGMPYAAHPIRVAFSMETEEERVVAFLHDVVEDAPHTLDMIEIPFGLTVRNAVDALTRRDDESYPEFIRRCALNPIARKVKLADIADNLRPERGALMPGLNRDRLRQRYERAKKILEAA